MPPGVGSAIGTGVSVIGGLVGSNKAEKAQKEAAKQQAAQSQAIMNMFQPALQAGTGALTPWLTNQFRLIGQNKFDQPYGVDYYNAQYDPLRRSYEDLWAQRSQSIGENYNDRGLNFSTAATDALTKEKERQGREQADRASALFANAIAQNEQARQQQLQRGTQTALGLTNAAAQGVGRAFGGQQNAAQGLANAGAIGGQAIGGAAGMVGGTIAGLFGQGGQQPTQYAWGNNSGQYPLVTGVPQPQYPLVVGTPEPQYPMVAPYEFS